MQIDRFNKDFPCNNQSVKVGEAIWVSERIDGKSVRTLGTVINTSDTGITAEVKRDGYNFEFSFGTYGHRRHSRFGGTFRVLPVTETNNKLFSEAEEHKMESILEAIKTYPAEFQQTLHARAQTTPSYKNKANHLDLIDAIEFEDWTKVGEILTDPAYERALEGVVYCLQAYSDIHNQAWHDICNLCETDKIV